MICQLDPPSSSTALAIVRRYGEAIAVVTLVTLLLTGSLVCRAVLYGTGAGWAELPLSYVFVALLLTGIYRILSTNRIEWRFCWYGAIITCALLLLGRALIQRYLLNFPVRGAYGQAGFLMVLMLWIYYSAQVFYFGAELIQARRTWVKWTTPT